MLSPPQPAERGLLNSLGLGPLGIMLAARSGHGSGGMEDRKRGGAVTGIFAEGSIGEFRVQRGGPKGAGLQSVS
jgi:hypothetical protein